MAQDRTSIPAQQEPLAGSRPASRLPLVVGVAIVLACMGILCTFAVVAGGVLSGFQSRATVAVRGTPVQQIADNSATPQLRELATTATTFVHEFVPTSTSLPPTPTIQPTPPATHTTSLSVTVATTMRQVRVFQKLWDVVNTNYIYPDFHGLDWHALRIKTLAKINDGIDDEQFYDLLRNAIDGLNDHHSAFLSPQEARNEKQEYEGSGNYTGIGLISEINLDKRYAYVLQVLPGSPADKAGIRAHEHILSINGQPSVLENDESNMPLLRGPVGSQVTVTVSAVNGKPRTLVLKRADLSTSTPVEHRIIISGTKRIGYLMIPTLFEDHVGDEVRAALNDLMKKGRLDGLVIDMRINGGGAYPVLMRCLGFFTNGTVGSLTSRAGVRKTLTARAEPVGNSQTVPIRVLVGQATASYAEVYAGALRAAGRAKVIGQKTAGNIETLHAHDFEDGSLAWIAEETFRLPDGTNWEGEGLAPDIAIDKAWDEITDESDPVVAAALKAF